MACGQVAYAAAAGRQDGQGGHMLSSISISKSQQPMLSAQERLWAAEDR
jgi:hypothetical protein